MRRKARAPSLASLGEHLSVQTSKLYYIAVRRWGLQKLFFFLIRGLLVAGSMLSFNSLRGREKLF
jgi:hypothetical protein